MKKALVALAGLLLLVAGTAHGQAGDTKTEIRGTYFVSIETTAGTGGTMIRFPQKHYGIKDAGVSTADSSQAVTFCNYLTDIAVDIKVYSDACPSASSADSAFTTVDVPTWFSFPSGGWLPGFSGGIDSLLVTSLAGTANIVIWGIN